MRSCFSGAHFPVEGNKKIHSTTEFQRVTHSTEEIGRKGVDYSFETFTHEGKQKEMDVRQGKVLIFVDFKDGQYQSMYVC